MPQTIEFEAEKEEFVMLEITLNNFDAEVKHSEKPVLLDFWASWCEPCKQFSPTVDAFAEEHEEIKVGKVNVDEARDLAFQFRVMGIPTLLLFKDGEKVASSTGVLTQEELDAWVKENL